MSKKKITITIEIDIRPKIRFLKSGRIFKDKTKYSRKKKHRGKEEL
jgi:hypothetical protein